MKDAFYSAETELTVEFYDVDSMEVMWHGNYVKFLEVARCRLLDEIGYGYRQMVEDDFVFPVTDLRLRYVRSLHFGEKALIRSSVMEFENCLKIRYEIYNQKGELCNKAETTQMAVRKSTGESQFVCPPLFVQRCKAAIEAFGEGKRPQENK